MAELKSIVPVSEKEIFSDGLSTPDQSLDTNVTRDAHSRGSRASQTLDRYVSFKAVLGLGLTLQASWEAIAITFQSSFLNGGPVTLVYGMLIVTAGSSALAATLGEMAAVDPAVGAQYRWSASYAPPKLRPHFWGFMQGWLTLVAWITACAGSPFSLGTVIQGIVEFNYPNYVPQRWHATLIMWAYTVFAVVGNLYARKLLVTIETVGGLLHLIFFVATVITLGVLVSRNSNEFVWNTSISGVSGWDNKAVSFGIGLLAPALSVAGFDGVIHMSDETKNATTIVPRGMVAAVLINGATAFSFAICLLYTMGDPEVTLDPTKTSLPYVGVLYNATKSMAATNLMASFLVIVLTVSIFGAFASVSRLTWAFAKDGGLPFAEFFSHVHPGLQVPVRSLILVGILCAILALINIASAVAFFAMMSLATFALFISYMPPIMFLTLRKLRGEKIEEGPWRLGRAGVYINIFGLCYAIFMVIWLPFPTTTPVTADTMNYAAPVWGGCMLLALVDYCFSGHKRFKTKI